MPGRLVDDRAVATNVSGQARSATTSTADGARRHRRSRCRRRGSTLAPGGSVVITITIESSERRRRSTSARSDLAPTHGRTADHAPAGRVRAAARAIVDADAARARRRRSWSVSESRCTVTAQNNAFHQTTVDLSTTFNDRLRITEVNGRPADRRTVGRALNDRRCAGEARRAVGRPRGRSRPATCRSTSFGVTPRRRSVTRTSSTSTCRRSRTTAATYTRIGVDSNGYVVAGGGTSRGQQLLQPAHRAEPGAAQQHAGAVLDRPRRHGRPGHPRRHAHRRWAHPGSSSSSASTCSGRRISVASRCGSAPAPHRT